MTKPNVFACFFVKLKQTSESGLLNVESWGTYHKLGANSDLIPRHCAGDKAVCI